MHQPPHALKIVQFQRAEIAHEGRRYAGNLVLDQLLDGVAGTRNVGVQTVAGLYQRDRDRAGKQQQRKQRDADQQDALEIYAFHRRA